MVAEALSTAPETFFDEPAGNRQNGASMTEPAPAAQKQDTQKPDSMSATWSVTAIEDAEAAVAEVYGLAGAVWSRDVNAAIDIARRIETGTVWVNQNLALRPDTPFAGMKQSGFGVENGMEGLLEYMAPQTVYVREARS